MNQENFTALLKLRQNAMQVFNAINNVPGWWSSDFEGSTAKAGDRFTVHFGAVFISSEVVELVPGRKIVWLVTDCNKPWLKDKKEWNGTSMCWEIEEQEEGTEVRFTHIGLEAKLECFDVCSNAWTGYLQGSLLSLITEGKGHPDPKKAEPGAVAGSAQ